MDSDYFDEVLDAQVPRSPLIQRSIHQAEGRRVGADAQGQGEDGHRREGGALPQRANGKPTGLVHGVPSWDAMSSPWSHDMVYNGIDIRKLHFET